MPTATAVWFPGPRSVELRAEELPAVGERDVQVEALASAISHGTEMLVYRGQVPPDVEFDLPTLRGSFVFPIKYGYASVGRVSAVGRDVRSVQVDDVVFALHPHQTAYVVPETMVQRLPKGVEPTRGVFLANLETAVNIVLDATPRLGERVAVFGQGVVGLLVTQILRRLALDALVVVDPLAHRRALSSAYGALAVAPEDTEAAVRDVTDGTGVDVAIEVSGNVAALDQAIASLAFGGTVVVASWYGTKPVELALGGAFHRRRVRLVSSQVSTIDAALQPRWSHQRRLAVARDLLVSLELENLISHRLPMKCAAEAYRLVDEHPEQTVQVVLTYV